MVRPQNLVTRDMIHVMHKEITLRTPNVNTPARRFAFDDIVVECRNFLDVRMLFKEKDEQRCKFKKYFTDFTTTPSRTSSTTTILVDTPNADDLESPKSPTTTIKDNLESPESPTTTIEDNLESTQESPASPTTTIEDNLEQAFDLGYDLTFPPNLELERSFGHYDYSSTSDSDNNVAQKAVHELYPVPESGKKF